MKTRYLFDLPFATISVYNDELEFLVDTGFNGELMLPVEKIREFNFSLVAITRYVLADGSVSETEVYEGQINWLGKKKRVSVVGSHSDFSLLGMELLSNARTILEPAQKILTIEMA